MEHRNKVNPAKLIAPYINSCYGESLYCDLYLVCAQNRVIPCHKLVLCSLSKKLLSICRDEDQAGDKTYIHLPDVSHSEVKETVDEIYASIGKKAVEFQKTEVISVLGIESTLTKPQCANAGNDAEVKEETQDYGVKDDFQSEGLNLGDFIKTEEDCDLTEEEEVVGYRKTSSLSQQLESLNVIRYNDYTATRHEFWEEQYVRVILKVSKLINDLVTFILIVIILQAIYEKEISMKAASGLLGISYNIMYGKYREFFGPLSKKRTSNLPTVLKSEDIHQRNSQFISHDLDSLNIVEYNEYTGTRQEFWDEHYVNVLLRVSIL